MAVALIVTLVVGAVLGLVGGYAIAADRESEAREACQALVKNLEDNLSSIAAEAQGGNAPLVIVDDEECLSD